VLVMGKRRRVSNLLALTMLSVLTTRPMHPYEIASVLRAWGKDQDQKIKWGTLYTVVQNLEKHGLIEAAETVQQGGRPERTVYRITDAGRAELADWVRELVAVPEREVPKFKAALSELGVLGPDEATSLLRERLQALEEQLAGDRDALAGYTRELPRLFLIPQEYDLAIREAEAAWLRSFVQELTDGTLPDMDLWRAYHDTGVMPPELTELQERETTG
jgi:DNA-binding PadR family transcriptional regulator